MGHPKDKGPQPRPSSDLSSMERMSQPMPANTETSERPRSTSLQRRDAVRGTAGTEHKELPNLPTAPDTGSSTTAPIKIPGTSRQDWRRSTLHNEHQLDMQPARYHEHVQTERLDVFNLDPPTYSWRRSPAPDDMEGLSRYPSDPKTFDKMCRVYADAVAIERAADRIIATSERWPTELFKRDYAQRMSATVVAAMCIKDDLEDHPLARKYKKEGRDIRAAGPEEVEANIGRAGVAFADPMAGVHGMRDLSPE
ncbi:uncharacterized protein LTR77_003316 [Saxophila tyrrhenica]|uniref:Uncharacterized protein n=1 Tax=Saxophila tyrrhenica TaxID=1690608 RepID=A0AAV9PJU8_9PEZI|nr:hypothetical protein LTR77_003316 [Saxophila tyrrhenica]